MVVRETPRGMLAFTVIIVIFDALSLAAGIALPAGYILSDILQSAYFLLASFLIGRHIVPAKYAPSLFASAIVVNNLALNYQFTFDPAGAGAGVIQILISVYGALVLFWLPFVASAVVMFAVSSYFFMEYVPVYAEAWMITMFTAFFVSCALMLGRRYMSLKLAQANQTIEAMAVSDQLTGLLNRHGFELSVSGMMALAERSGQGLSVAFIDVSGLKAVNDVFGHETGDVVLTRTAAALRAQARSADLVARWGGDEFLIVGVGELISAEEVGQRIVGALDLAGLEGEWNGQVSVGTAAGDPAELDRLIAAADQHMYARRNGEERITETL